MYTTRVGRLEYSISVETLLVQSGTWDSNRADSDADKQRQDVLPHGESRGKESPADTA